MANLEYILGAESKQNLMIRQNGLMNGSSVVVNGRDGFDIGDYEGFCGTATLSVGQMTHDASSAEMTFPEDYSCSGYL